MPQRIQRRRKKGWRFPPGAIYVGRPTKWGNPFRVEHNPAQQRPWSVTDDQGATQRFDTEWDAARWAVACYSVWLAWPQQSALRRELPELAGHDLVCWCPLIDERGVSFPCHADILLEMANVEVPDG